jgi:hypothetical protein
VKVFKSEIERIRQAIVPLDTEIRREEYRNGQFPRAEFVKDINRRYRWDLYWACGKRFGQDDLLDSHIDTALKKIIPSLEEK